MRNHLHYISIDKTKIKTKLRIYPDLFDDPSSYIDKHRLQIRTQKLSPGKCKQGPTLNLTLEVLAYKGIKVKLRKIVEEPLTEVTIEFNPCVCLFGHNGRVLLLREFCHALAILVKYLRPILLDPNDWVDLIPGLRSKGVAYWHFLEIFLQLLDRDGRVLNGFSNAQRDKCQTPIRHWDDSMEIGSKRSNMQFSIYRKFPEMLSHNKISPDQLENEKDILRLEIRLMENKLVKYFPNERNVEEIDGVMRLVRFYPQDCVDAHRASYSELRGVYHPDEPLWALKPNAQNAPLGRLLALVSRDPRTSHTFQELRHHLQFYTGASSTTMSSIRSAGIEYLSHLSSLIKEELFSDAAYRAPSSITSEMKEKDVVYDIQDTWTAPLIHKAYWPPDQQFLPVIDPPSYFSL